MASNDNNIPPPDISGLSKYILGDIYMITNNINGMKYIGQAPKYLGSNRSNWGYLARWTRHKLESDKDEKHQRIKEAMREFGYDNFEVTLLCECNVSDMDYYESLYIEHYNALFPNGYNDTTGGKNGKHSECANEKQKVNMRNPELIKEKRNVIKRDYSDILANTDNMVAEISERDYDSYCQGDTILADAIKNDDKLFIKNAEQLFKVYKKKGFFVDNIPKDCIFPKVEDHEITGYFVYGLLDFENKPITMRSFDDTTNRYNVINAAKFVDLVNEYNANGLKPGDWLTVELSERKVDILSIMDEFYSTVINDRDYKSLDINLVDMILSNDEFFVKNLEKVYKAWSQPKFFIPDLPMNNIYPIIEGRQITGYCVYGLLDYQQKPIPMRVFDETTNTYSIEKALKFIDIVNQYNKKKSIPDDWLTVKLPKKKKDTTKFSKYIRPTTYNGIQTGYRVDYFIKYHEVTKKRLYERKCFSNEKDSMEDKFEMAKKFVEEMDKIYKSETARRSRSSASTSSASSSITEAV